MVEFVSGAIALASLVVAMFFFRFFTVMRDRLFLYFGIAFSILVIERILLLVIGHGDLNQPPIYFCRLTAFAIIIWGIVDKNRKVAPKKSK